MAENCRYLWLIDHKALPGGATNNAILKNSNREQYMETKPVIFVSYCQKYGELKDLFAQLIEAIGFQPEIFDAGSTMNVPETERLLINKCDGFIGILTPDEETSSGHLCSPNVTAEIAMAYAANKPIQLFAIDEVNFSVLPFTQINTITKLKIFNSAASSSALAFDATNIRQIFRTLIEFKKHIDIIYQQKWPTSDPVFLYKLFEIRQDIFSSTHLHLRNSIDAVAQCDVDTHTHAARLLCDRGTKDGIALKMADFKFKMFKPVGYKPNIGLVDNGYSSFRFTINYQQPIPKGTEIKYAFERKHDNYFPYTREELGELLKAGSIKSTVMIERAMIGQDFYVTQPTERVRFVLSFPTEYPIEKYSAVACYGKSELIHNVETNRAGALIQLNYDEFDEKYTLTLEVPNPHLGMTYFLLYEPPTSGVLSTKG